MKRVFIGHRGVGKSSLLRRHQTYFPEIAHFDLDDYIEEKTRTEIATIFSRQGEAVFRDLERKFFTELGLRESFVVAVGGGFDPSHIPPTVEVIFVTRRTDSDGRIFLNRPRILPEVSALEESVRLFQKRDAPFRERADFIYHMPEGIESPNDTELAIFTKKNFNVEAYVTLKKFSPFGFKFSRIELRTDIWSEIEIAALVAKHPEINFLISYRHGEQTLSSIIPHEKKIKFDWALENGPVPDDFTGFVSSHDERIETALQNLDMYPQHDLKLCPVIRDWDELARGYEWQSKNPERRSFLPRSEPGEKSRWRWFRQFMLSRQPLNFLQGLQDFDDQPSLFEALGDRPHGPLAAVLGNPVHHSRTPVEQARTGFSFVSVPIEEKDFGPAIRLLNSLGLKLAAVTSPLKKAAGYLCGSIEEMNTLYVKGDAYYGVSTDSFGFEKLSRQISENSQHVAVWGGGGVLGSLARVRADLVLYSARTGQIKNNKLNVKPDVLIWAAPRKAGVKWPEDVYPDWQPRVIIDLNYAENSMGLECAQRMGCAYISGLAMFKEQAMHQRNFWFEELRHEKIGSKP